MTSNMTKVDEIEAGTVHTRSTQSSAHGAPGGLRPDGGGGGGAGNRKFSIMSTASHRSSTLQASKGGGGRSRKRDLDFTDGMRTSVASPQQENTYKLAPDVRFNTRRVQDVAQQTLEARLSDVAYSSTMVRSMTMDLSEDIKLRVKALGFPRHKLIVHVIIGPIGGQAVQVASRCVWDDKQDNHASVSYQNSSLFAVASVYAIYFE